MDETPSERSPQLIRGLGPWDGALLTIGAMVGTGIFITTGDIAKSLPYPGLILLVWFLSGLLTLAGALTYAELGTMFPRAGGMYHFLREAYGPLPGFLYGWTCFLVIMSGGIAAIAVGFAEYLGVFLPFFSTQHVLLAVPVGPWRWTLSGGQVAAAAAIAVLTVINYVGLKEGAWVQNLLTIVKIGAVVGFAALGFFAVPQAQAAVAAPAVSTGLVAAFGIGMIASLWSYDGWYGLALSAGEVRDPGRNLPRGLAWGTAAVIAMYMLLNVVYLRALPLAAMASTPRIGEDAAAALFGAGGARVVSLLVVVSAFGCLAATILYSARIYLPMAQDGLFFRALGDVQPRFRTPGHSLLAQGVWSIVLTVSGTYSDLYTYAMFAAVLFHVATGATVFVLRRTRPDMPRPYRVWGYPWVPVLFIAASGFLVVNTLAASPVASLWGLGLVALGLPAYAYWRRRPAPAGGAALERD
ncbi:MAG TPA: amino acid permease [Thermoanaerobaculaceae bacterium]|nr:amino acid permease [Thermoanaerobaculaceae bacterium]